MLYIFVQHLALFYSMFVLFPCSGNYSGTALDMRFIEHLTPFYTDFLIVFPPFHTDFFVKVQHFHIDFRLQR